MMTPDEYLSRFKSEYENIGAGRQHTLPYFMSFFTPAVRGDGFVQAGVLEFGEGSQAIGCAFLGNCSVYTVTDYSKVQSNFWELPTLARVESAKVAAARKSTFYAQVSAKGKAKSSPYRYPTPAQPLLPRCVEYPVSAYISGCDDGNMIKYYAMVEEAQADMALLETGPITRKWVDSVWVDDLHDLGFHFA